ncbi:MAG: MFS transporter [Spirochaetales bacterium]|nr:MFS transporter [Spirochaetales bacterium]
MKKAGTRVTGSTAGTLRLMPWLHTGSLYLIYLLLGMNLASVGPCINDLSAQNNVDVEVFSMIFIIRTLGALAGSLFGVRLYDRLSAKTILLFILLASIILFAGIPLVTTFFVTASLFFLIGFVYSLSDAGGNIIITRLHGKNSAPFLSGLHFCFGIGAFLIPLVIAQIRLYTGSAVYAYWFIAAAAVLIAMVVTALPPPPEGKKSFAAIHKETKWIFIFFSMLFFFFFVGVELGFGVWIYNYALAREVADEQTAAYLTSLFYGVYTVTRLLIIPLAACFDNRKILILSLTGGLVCFFIMLVSPAVPWLIFAITAGIGFFLAPVFPLTITLIEKKSGLTGKVAGFLQIGMVLGGMVFPWILGQLLKPPEHYFLPLILGLSMAAALGMEIVLVFMKTVKNN